MGVPIRAAIPWNRMSKPKALFNFSIPRSSHRTMDLRAMNAAKNNKESPLFKS